MAEGGSDHAATISNILEKTSISEQNKRYPWLPIDLTFENPLEQLDAEILQFYKYMQLTTAEHLFRNNVKAKIESVVKRLWPNAYLEIIGSTISGLALPNSNLDLFLNDASGELLLQRVGDLIIGSDIAEPNTMKVKDNTKFRSISFVEKDSKLEIELFLWSKRCLPQNSLLVKEYEDAHTNILKPLVFVIKHFMKLRNMNVDIQGGISSYALLIMCIISLNQPLKRDPPHPDPKNRGVGDLLLEFFETFGERFDYDTVGITLRRGGSYFPKNLIPCYYDGGIGNKAFCIEDPQDNFTNVNNIAVHLPNIKNALSDGFNLLLKAVTSDEDTVEVEPGLHSILGSIIYVSDDLIKFRKRIHDTYKHFIRD